MTDSKEPLEALRQFLPIRIQKAQRGWGSFLTFDGFTHPGSEVSLHLWIYLCDWELTLGPDCILNSDVSEDHRFKSALAPIINSNLTRISELSQGKLILEFDSDHCLTMKSDTREYEIEDDLFLTYLNDRCFVCYSHVRGFYFVP